MKSILTIAIVTWSLLSSGQIIKLEPSNPAPRVGDEIYITFTLEKNNFDSLDIANDPIALLMIPSMNRIGDAYILLSEWFLTDVGPLKIGPIQIPLNEKVFLTNQLEMTVYPRLPGNVREGIWVRTLELQGTNYIILEQRKARQMVTKFDPDGRATMTWSNGEGRWAEINMDKIQRMFVEIEPSNSHTYVQDTDKGEASCNVTIYTYKPLESFKGKLTLDESFLIFAPEKTYFEYKDVDN